MARASIYSETSTREWEIGALELQVRLWKATMRATKMAMYLVERNVKFYLRTFSHPVGTPTPSPRGGPPALVTGNLIRSWRNEPMRPGSKQWTVEVTGGPTAVYSRIQELSGQAGRGHLVHIPARPYVRPMVLASRRGVYRMYMEHWAQALAGE